MPFGRQSGSVEVFGRRNDEHPIPKTYPLLEMVRYPIYTKLAAIIINTGVCVKIVYSVASIQQGRQKVDPKNRIEQIGEPREIESHKRLPWQKYREN